jgi:hypothetical protein
MAKMAPPLRLRFALGSRVRLRRSAPRHQYPPRFFGYTFAVCERAVVDDAEGTRVEYVVAVLEVPEESFRLYPILERHLTRAERTDG